MAGIGAFGIGALGVGGSLFVAVILGVPAKVTLLDCPKFGTGLGDLQFYPLHLADVQLYSLTLSEQPL